MKIDGALVNVDQSGANAHQDVYVVATDDLRTFVVTGALGGANFTLAVPDPWNRNILIYAHGYRPLAAEL